MSISVIAVDDEINILEDLKRILEMMKGVRLELLSHHLRH